MSAIAFQRALAYPRKGWTGKRDVRETTTNRRRDKRGTPDRPQAIGMACVLPCRLVVGGAASSGFVKDFKAVSGTMGLGRNEESAS